MPPPSRPKPITRQTVLSRRDALTPTERQLASTRIAERANDLLRFRGRRGAYTVALYAPKGSEVETWMIDEHVRAIGGRVVYPRIVDEARVLEFHEVAPEQLVPARFGLREPRADWRNVVGIIEIAAFVVPGLAFDKHGGRIGWGRGHYDATLALAAPDAVKLGLAFECQLVDDVPREPHDTMMDHVITEAATY